MSRVDDILGVLAMVEKRQVVRPRKGERAVLTVKDLLTATTKLRTKINPIGKVEVTSMAPLPRNKQIIMKFQVHAKTKGKSMYPATVVFHKVSFSDVRDKEHPLTISSGKGNQPVYAAQLSASKTPVSVRCGCKDFFFVWYYYDYERRALAGPKFRQYQRKTPPPPEGYPYKNPIQTPGLCKHLIGIFKLLQKERVLIS